MTAQGAKQGGGGGELTPRPGLGALLKSSLEPDGEVLPWYTVARLVAAAAPVNVPWYQRLPAPQRPLRYAMGAVTAAFACVAVLAALPAQSDQVGTLIVTSLPSGWQDGSAAYDEVRQAAQQRFATLGIPQGELHMMTAARSGRDQLAFALLGTDGNQAQGFYQELSGSYPALAGFDADYQPIDSGRYGSLLNELLVRISTAGRVGRASDAELRASVLKALGDSGLTDIEVMVRHTEDGRVLIKVEGDLDISVRGHSREDLEAQGLSEELLGREDFQRLLQELELPAQ